MLRKPLVMLLCALVLAAGFCYGVGRLFILRYERGDDYPAYSTLRSDPLGTRGVYEALDQLPGVDVQRNFRPLPRLKPESPITLVYAGLTYASMWESSELQHFQSLVVDGSRAVFTFVPVQRKPQTDEQKRAEADERARREKEIEEERRSDKSETPPEKKKPETAEEEKKDQPGTPAPDSTKEDEETPPKKDDAGDRKKPDSKDGGNDDDEEFTSIVLIDFDEAMERWGGTFDFLPVDKDRKEDAPLEAVLADESADLEPKIVWRSVFCFKDLKPEWRVLYRCEGRPVIIERSFGRGSIVLAADSSFLTNQSLRAHRYPKLLARLFDGPPTFVFDEDHLGVKENPGIASLTRKYRLHGVVFGLLLIAVLFIWKNAVRFIPAYVEDVRGDTVAGKESAEGFVNLLRRTIRPAEIIALCAAEWRKSTTHRAPEQARVEEILSQDAALPARQRNPVATYQAIAQTLTRR